MLSLVCRKETTIRIRLRHAEVCLENSLLITFFSWENLNVGIINFTK